MTDQELSKNDVLDLLNIMKALRGLLANLSAGSVEASNIEQALGLMEACIPKKYQVFL